MARATLDDWSDIDLNFAERLLRLEIGEQGPKEAFDYALQAIQTLNNLKALVESDRALNEPYEPPGACPWECHLIGGPWIAENPDCPFHGANAQPVPKWLGERLLALKSEDAS